MKNEMNHDRDELDRNAGLDFGSDADVVPDEDPAFDAWIKTMAPTLNAPNAAPRLEMWSAIQTARRTAGATPRRRVPWGLMSAIAAALLVGVAIDRVALREVDPASPTVATAPAAPAPSDSDDPSRLYRMAATQTLTQAEALLTAFRASSATEQPPVGMQQLGTWGRQVLGSTRLLIDSPAGQDPQLRALLDDLELVLVQIIQLSGGQLDATDRALVEGALEQSDLLPRIRTVVPAGVPGPDAVSGD
ncbi:MAG TPA: hypothetical protein VJ802_16870 [Gemmatimonadaceae bacterium]|nr:hypothetical protein [Gemmatimonadaceae bacterium]